MSKPAAQFSATTGLPILYLSRSFGRKPKRRSYVCGGI